MSYTHLSRHERECIHRWRLEKLPVEEMASLLGRNPSTIHREFKRNASGPNSYIGAVAHTMYRKRIRWERTRVLDSRSLVGLVDRRLEKKWSPEQIANRLTRAAHPWVPEHGVSSSTIYRHIKRAKRNGEALHTHLRRFGNLRPKRYGSGPDGRGRIADRVSIDVRPSVVDAQLRIGDFEGDTMHGPNRKGGIATFVDRASLYTLATWIPDRSTEVLIDAARRCFHRVPHKLRHTMTVDNGPEFRSHKALSQALAMPIYFAHPYASWERPINENTNGLLRQFFPKKQPLLTITEQSVKDAVEALNHRPRKKLGYKTPHEVFWNATRT